MQGTYGTSKIDVAAVTDAAVQYLRDTDLGITFDTRVNSSPLAANIPTPPPGTTGTINDVVPGSGYTLGDDKVLVQTATDGAGTGLRIQTSIIQSGGILKAGSTVGATASFQTFQNNLRKNYTGVPTADPYTYARITATGKPMAETTALTSTALASTSTSGTGATSFVDVLNGSVNKVTVSVVGSGYSVGDVITITNTVLEAGAAFGGGFVFQGDLKIILTADNIFGGIWNASQIRILTPGKGHAVGDVITFKEEGTDNVGTGTVEIATLQTLGGTVISATPQNKTYPSAVRNTSNAVGTITVVSSNGNISTLGNVQAGQIIPISFAQIQGAGTGLTVGFVQVLYK